MEKDIIVDNIFVGMKICSNGNIITETGEKIKTYPDSRGYLTLLVKVNKKIKKLRVHRLVALAFIPNPENKREVNHINGIKDDNRVENLEWVTSSENMLHAYRTGLHKPIQGEKHANSIYTEKDVRKVCELLERGLGMKQISEMTGISRATIKDINIGRSWKHISSEYDFSKSSRRKYKELYPIIDNAIRRNLRKRDIVNILLANDIMDECTASYIIGNRRKAVKKHDSIYLTVTFV